jgi:hypothetical protein
MSSSKRAGLRASYVRAALALLGFVLLSGSGWPDGRPRKRKGMYPNLRAVALLQHQWAPEPESPQAIDRTTFARALEKLCYGGGDPRGAAREPYRERAERYAAWIEESARAHGEDPFLLGALVYRMSQCRPEFSNAQGHGLTALDPEMFSANIRGRALRYAVPQEGGFVEREKVLSRVLTAETARDAQTNLEWAAAVLGHFDQASHRHYASHFIWGDGVPSDREEDRVFTDRRRLLGYYGLPTPERTVTFRNLLWGSPLEASPRVVSSAPGAARDAGLRRHKGVDVESLQGEPVLAMADGTVFFAGVDMPGQGARALEPQQVKRVARRRMGRGGRFVCIDHFVPGPDEAFLQSCYMHLEDVHVRIGEVVKRGQPIGTVGRTGCKHSAPHLHLEIKSDKRRYDARDIVPGILIGEPPREPPRKRRSVPRV